MTNTFYYLTNFFIIFQRVDFDNGSLDRSDNSLSNRIGRTTRVGGNTPIERFRRKSSKKLKKRKLVFIEDSPDYCRKNVTAGKQTLFLWSINDVTQIYKYTQARFFRFRAQVNLSFVTNIFKLYRVKYQRLLQDLILSFPFK